jgi:hypothetical protein
MTKEKQIIEIKECIDAVYGADCAYYDVDGFAIANEIYNVGYRKQSEGEWVKHYRSGVTVSRGYVSSCCDMWNNRKSHFCHNCGAKMKGGAE